MNTKNISSVLFGVCFLVLTCFYYYRTIRILIEKPRTTVSEMKTWIKYVVIVSLILSIIFLLIPIYMIVSHDYFGFGRHPSKVILALGCLPIISLRIASTILLPVYNEFVISSILPVKSPI
jgi:hypothetical protein